MSNVTFSQLPNLATGNITANTIIPVVEDNVNYTVTTANLQTYINGTANGIVTSNLTVTGNIAYSGPTTTGNFNVNLVQGNVSNTSGYQLSFNIPSAGIWAINMTVGAEVDFTGTQPDQLYMGLFNGSNTQVGNTFVVIAHSGTDVPVVATSTGAQIIVTTTGAETFWANAVGTVRIVSASAFGTYVKLNPTVGSKTFDGFMTIDIGGNTRYIPYFS